MSKSKRQRRRPTSSPEIRPSIPAASPTVSVQLGFDPTGPSEPIDIVSSKEGWSEYTLEDGTVIRTKGVLLAVKKMTGQFNPEGEPVYVMQLTSVNQARVPEQLKKKSA
jgi:hypothetical protein